MKTAIGTNIEQPFVGYMLNTALSEENQRKIANLQAELTKRFSDTVWHQPPHSLHITLCDWIAPLVEYGEDKDELFKKIFNDYDRVVSRALQHVTPITVQFDKVQLAPPAIFGVGNDDGEFARIRQHFLDNIELLPNTKKPPTIIHFTISRFLKEVEMEPIEEFLRTVDFSMKQEISSFRLVRENIDPMLDFKVIKEYKLGL